MNERREFTGGGVEEFFPYDGPHSPERVIDAAAGVAALVRYLNNATGPGRCAVTLRWASTAHYALGGIVAAVHGFDQLFDQFAEAMHGQAVDPTLYDDRRDRPAGPTARAVATQLDQARSLADDLAAGLDAIRELTVHLGNDEGGRR